MLAYPMLVKEILPAPMVGFFAAVMVGAVLSTFNSVLNSSATLFSQGIYHVFLNRDATGREMVWSGRACSIVLAIAAMIAAPMINTDGSLYNYLQKINATFFGPMLAVIVLGLLTKFVTARSAKVAMIVGPIMFYLLTGTFDAEVQNFAKNLVGTSDNIHFLHFLALVFVITSVLMILISKIKPEQSTERVSEAVNVDMTPWKHANVAGLIISALVIIIYALMAQ